MKCIYANIIIVLLLALTACNAKHDNALRPDTLKTQHAELADQHLASFTGDKISDNSQLRTPLLLADEPEFSIADLSIELESDTAHKPLQLPDSSQKNVTVSVSAVPVGELLFALARDAGIDIDIDTQINTRVSINAVNKPLSQVLTRIMQQAPVEMDYKNDVLVVRSSGLHLVAYKIPYLNMVRDSLGGMSLAVQVGSTGSLLNDGNTAKSNNSSVDIENKSTNNFWDELVQNIRAIVTQKMSTNLGRKLNADAAVVSKSKPAKAVTTKSKSVKPVEADKSQESDQEAEEDLEELQQFAELAVSANKSAGIITVRANKQTHQQVQKYLQAVLKTARRQVLIEATVAEVELNDTFESGVDWSRILQANKDKGWSLAQNMRSEQQRSGNQANIAYIGKGEKYDVQATISLLEKFGNVKVLSSPKIMALNNQASVLKVVDNRVYFSLDVLTTNEDGVINRTFGSEVKTVPEGFMMVVMPNIDDNGDVILNIRPTITRVVRFIDDPNPALAEAKVRNPVPEIQVRELETVLRLKSGQVAVLGGLMQDSTSSDIRQVPYLGRVPVAGELFKGRSKVQKKSELIVFLRPVTSVVRP